MAEKKQIIFDLEVEGLNSIKSTENALKAVNKQIKDVDTSTEEGRKEFEKLAETQALLKNRTEDYRKASQNQQKALRSQENSLEGLRAKLAVLTKERNGIDLASDRFQELQKEILQTTQRIKGVEEEAGDFRRSVGNYQRATEGATLGTGKFSQGISGLNQVIRGNPLGLMITAIVLLTDKISAATPIIDGLSRLFTPLFTVVERVVGIIQNGLIAAFEEISKGNIVAGIKAFGNSFEDFGDQVQEAALQGGKIADLTIEIEKGEIALIKTQAELRKVVAQNRIIAEDTTKATNVRIEAAKRAFEAEQEIEAARVKQIELQLKQARLKAAQNDTDRETQKEIATLEAEIDKAAEERFSKQTELQNKLNALRKESQNIIDQEIKKEQELIDKTVEAEQLEELEVEDDPINDVRVKREQEINDLLIEDGERYLNAKADQAQREKEIDESTALAAEASAQAKINSQRLLLSQFANLSNALTGIFEQNTIANKAAAITDAVINTYLGATQALGTLPPPASYVAASATIAQGLAAVKKITEAKPSAAGGLPPVQLRSETAGGQIDPRQLQSVFRSFEGLQPVVRVSDIDRVGTQVSVRETESSL